MESAIQNSMAAVDMMERLMGDLMDSIVLDTTFKMKFAEVDLGILITGVLRTLRYSIEEGGIFLKDAAALDGLGVIGRHNLFISPQYGSRLRLRGLFLDRGYETSVLTSPSPCAHCAAPCHAACPEQAFQAGHYEVKRCEPEMQRNRQGLVTVEGSLVGMEESCEVEQFCRACELACPVGR